MVEVVGARAWSWASAATSNDGHIVNPNFILVVVHIVEGNPHFLTGIGA